MQISPNGKRFIISNEGTCFTIKPDNVRPMIGHGHDMTPQEVASGIVYGIDVRHGINASQADYILDQDCTRVYDPALIRLLPATANQNQIDAIGDFMYNAGEPNTATMLHHGWDKVPVNILSWVYGRVNGVGEVIPSLQTRRQKELELFQS